MEQPKQRKGQTADQYEAQRRAFAESGPLVNTTDWLFRIDGLDLAKKVHRMQVLHACERAYFLRDYEKCMQFVEKAEAFFGPGSERERHGKELQHIKAKCREKMDSAAVQKLEALEL